MEVNEDNPEMLKYSQKPKGCCFYPHNEQAKHGS